MEKSVSALYINKLFHPKIIVLFDLFVSPIHFMSKDTQRASVGVPTCRVYIYNTMRAGKGRDEEFSEVTRCSLHADWFIVVRFHAPLGTEPRWRAYLHDVSGRVYIYQLLLDHFINGELVTVASSQNSLLLWSICTFY